MESQSSQNFNLIGMRIGMIEHEQILIHIGPMARRFSDEIERALESE